MKHTILKLLAFVACLGLGILLLLGFFFSERKTISLTGAREVYFLPDGNHVIANNLYGGKGNITIIESNDKIISTIPYYFFSNNTQWSLLDLKQGNLLLSKPGKMYLINLKTLRQTCYYYHSNSYVIRKSNDIFILFDISKTSNYFTNIRIAYKSQKGGYCEEKLTEILNCIEINEFQVLQVLDEDTLLLKNNATFYFYHIKNKKFDVFRCPDSCFSGYYNRYEDTYCLVSGRHIESYDLQAMKWSSIDNISGKITSENFIAALEKQGIVLYHLNGFVRAWYYAKGYDVSLEKIQYKVPTFPNKDNDSDLWYIRSFLPCDYFIKEDDNDIHFKFVNRQGMVSEYRITENSIVPICKGQIELNQK